jgi:phosphoribosyl-AMP cyclohydrolase
MPDSWLNKVNWTHDGLVPVIVQEDGTGQMLMFAWMDREALRLTVETGHAVFWSRSRKKLWHKGEESGHVQVVKEIRLIAMRMYCCLQWNR